MLHARIEVSKVRIWSWECRRWWIICWSDGNFWELFRDARCLLWDTLHCRCCWIFRRRWLSCRAGCCRVIVVEILIYGRKLFIRVIIIVIFWNEFIFRKWMKNIVYIDKYRWAHLLHPQLWLRPMVHLRSFHLGHCCRHHHHWCSLQNHHCRLTMAKSLILAGWLANPFSWSWLELRLLLKKNYILKLFSILWQKILQKHTLEMFWTANEFNSREQWNSTR